MTWLLSSWGTTLVPFHLDVNWVDKLTCSNESNLRKTPDVDTTRVTVVVPTIGGSVAVVQLQCR